MDGRVGGDRALASSANQSGLAGAYVVRVSIFIWLELYLSCDAGQNRGLRASLYTPPRSTWTFSTAIRCIASPQEYYDRDSLKMPVMNLVSSNYIPIREVLRRWVQ